MSEFSAIGELFERNANSAYELLEFDRYVLEHVVGGLGALADELESTLNNNAAQTVRRRVEALEKINQNASLRSRYRTIYNQCVVLLVSYFGSAVHSLFLKGVAVGLRGTLTLPVVKQEVKLTWSDLAAQPDNSAELFAALLVAQRDISFQDMQSIKRAFEDHLGLPIHKDGDVNNLILGQAARHVIVHCGGAVDVKMVRQVSGATPRQLKAAVVEGEPLSFSPEEVKALGKSMTRYIKGLIGRLEELTTQVDLGALPAAVIPE